MEYEIAFKRTVEIEGSARVRAKTHEEAVKLFREFGGTGGNAEGRVLDVVLDETETQDCELPDYIYQVSEYEDAVTGRSWAVLEGDGDVFSFDPVT